MRFVITRTSSSYGDEQPPCPEATPGMVQVWDARTFTSAEDFDRTVARQLPRDGRWLDHGTEHQQVRRPDGTVYIKRRLEDRPAWFVEIGSLGELVAFAGRYGEVIVGDHPPSIEIYDDYRE